jgi:hypothetical protein
MMYRITYLLFCVLLSSILFSCVPENARASDIDNKGENEQPKAKSNIPVSVKDYLAYVNNPKNGLCTSKEIGEVIYTLQYKPLEYLIILEKQKDSISKNELEGRMDELKDMKYFTLKIEAKNNKEELLKYKLSSDEEYYERIRYFSFDMQKDIYLKNSKDSIPCSLFHFERTYGVVPYANFVLGFLNQSKSNSDGDQYFTFYDQVFDGGKINIKILKSDIQRIPKLITY